MRMLPVLVVLDTYCYILNISYIIMHNIIFASYRKSIWNDNLNKKQIKMFVFQIDV